MGNALIWVGRHAKVCLLAGLAAGLLLPELAKQLQPWIGFLVALLLFVTGMRVGARQAIGSLKDLGSTLVFIGAFQTVLPLIAIALLGALGLSHLPLALAVSLMLAAPSLTGAPNFAIMMKQNPAPGMRLLVLGTALFPLTALPVLLILDPVGGGGLSALTLSFGLLVAILVAVGAGFAVRRVWAGLGQTRSQDALDGCAALLLAIVVIGLMSAIGPLLRSDPVSLALWMLAALAINFGLVFATYVLMARLRPPLSLPVAIFAGNRNIALFLIVLPPEIAAPLMIFVGCYQVPMYLTPMVLQRLTGYQSR